MVTPGSAKKVWWRCKKHGHSWQAVISSRTRKNGKDCPYCANRKVLVGFNDLATVRPDIAEEWDKERNDGLTPNMVLPGSNQKVWWRCKKHGHSWQATISNRTRPNGNDCPYCTNRKVLSGFNDLATMRPDIATEWDDDRNEDLRPNMVLPGSSQKVWWRCKAHNHSWQTTINSRTKPKGTDCPYCTNSKVLSGFNDLMTLRPDIAEEWDNELNGDLRPNMALPGSGEKVWWRCKKHGHRWQTKINSRTNGSNCPYCTNHKAWPGFNDLATVRPDIAAEWDDELNGDLRPEMVVPGSEKKVWWRNKDGRRWQARIKNRTQIAVKSSNYPKGRE